MAVRNALLGGSDWGSEALTSTDLNDTFDASVASPSNLTLISMTRAGAYTMYGIAAHSATLFSLATSNGTYLFNSSAQTWTQKSATITADALIENCDANRAYAIAIETGATPDSVYTSDSGTTWSESAGETGATVTAVKDISFPTTTVAVIACVVSSGVSIWRSINGGNNWAVASSGPTATCDCVHMFDGSKGVAIDDSNNIWYTEDGGANWTDSTYNSSNINAVDGKVLVTTATGTWAAGSWTYWFRSATPLYWKGTNGAAPVAAGLTVNHNWGLKNGTQFVYFSDWNDVATNYSASIFYTTDSGTTWKLGPSFTMLRTGAAERHVYVTDISANQYAMLLETGSGGMIYSFYLPS